MTTSSQENSCVIRGSLEDQAYESLFKNLLGSVDPQPTTMKEFQAALNQKLQDLKEQTNKDAEIQKQIQEIEALNAEYQIFLDNKKKGNTQFIPLFNGDSIASIDVIVPNCPASKTSIENNPFTQRALQTPDSGTGATIQNSVTFMGFDKPANATYKVNFNNNCTMIFDKTDKISVQARDTKNPLSPEEIKMFQKHVLANVYRNPDAPINLNFPKNMDEKQKFQIINEMIVAYMSVTGTQGKVDTKGAETRREQFITNLTKGGTITLSDTISLDRTKAPNIFVGSIEGSILKPVIEMGRSVLKDENQHRFISKETTQDVVKEYQETMKLLNRQEIMMSMLNQSLDKAHLEGLVANGPSTEWLAARESFRSTTNVARAGAHYLSKGIGSVLSLGTSLIGSEARLTNEGLPETVDRKGLETSYRSLIQASLAKVVLDIASRGDIDGSMPIDLSSDALKDLKETKAYKNLRDKFGITDGEMETFLNATEIKTAIQKIKEPTAMNRPTIT